MKHCDDFIDDPAQPEALRQWLQFNRLPASCKCPGWTADQVTKLRDHVSAEERPHIWTDPAPVLFASLKAGHQARRFTGGHDKNGPVFLPLPLKAGQRVRVVMASRFGDVGITDNLNAEHGYDLRLGVEDLTDFSTEPEA